MKKSILKYLCAITIMLFVLISLASASSFSDIKYTSLGHFNAPGADYYITEDEEEIQRLIKENNIHIPDNSKITLIGICAVKERKVKINQTEKAYLRNITEHGSGYFEKEYSEQKVFSGKLVENKTKVVKPHLQNTSRIFDFLILKNIISDTSWSLKTSTEYEYISDEKRVKMITREKYSSGAGAYEKQKNEYETEELDISEKHVYSSGKNPIMLTVWDVYTHVTFESYNIFKNEWETGELYIPEGTVYMTVEYEKTD